MAKEKENKEAARQILAIIQRKTDERFWWRMTFALRKPRGGACFRVQVEQGDGTTEEYTGQEELQEAIWDNIHQKRFHLAESAPLCQEPLSGTFGYNAICQTSQEILDRKYEYPPEFNEATKEILQEYVLICLKIPVSLLDTLITREDWRNHWRRAKEETSSLMSGRHFSHYMAVFRSTYIAHLQSLFASVIIKQGIVLEQWLQGLFFMLEKIFGCTLITKLRSILLMEADFNATNKTIYSIRMLANVWKYALMPEEVYSKQNCLADNGTLSKVLFFDITRQLRRPAGLASIDADNCYNRIAYPMASMIFQAFSVPASQPRPSNLCYRLSNE